MPATAVHNGVQCDTCGCSPIVGRRYRCVDCSGAFSAYDFCEDCRRKDNPKRGHVHAHAWREVNGVSTPAQERWRLAATVLSATRVVGAFSAAGAADGDDDDDAESGQLLRVDSVRPWVEAPSTRCGRCCGACVNPKIGCVVLGLLAAGMYFGGQQSQLFGAKLSAESLRGRHAIMCAGQVMEQWGLCLGIWVANEGAYSLNTALLHDGIRSEVLLLTLPAVAVDAGWLLMRGIQLIADQNESGLRFAGAICVMTGAHLVALGMWVASMKRVLDILTQCAAGERLAPRPLPADASPCCAWESFWSVFDVAVFDRLRGDEPPGWANLFRWLATEKRFFFSRLIALLAIDAGLLAAGVLAASRISPTWTVICGGVAIVLSCAWLLIIWHVSCEDVMPSQVFGSHYAQGAEVPYPLHTGHPTATALPHSHGSWSCCKLLPTLAIVGIWLVAKGSSMLGEASDAINASTANADVKAVQTVSVAMASNADIKAIQTTGLVLFGIGLLASSMFCCLGTCYWRALSVGAFEHEAGAPFSPTYSQQLRLLLVEEQPGGAAGEPRPLRPSVYFVPLTFAAILFSVTFTVIACNLTSQLSLLFDDITSSIAVMLAWLVISASILNCLLLVRAVNKLS